MGIPALRIKGLYLALVTLGLAAIFPSIVQLDSLDEYTAGAAGKKVNSDIAAPGWLPLDGIASVLQKIPFFGQYFGDGDLSSNDADRIWKFFVFTVVGAICFWMVANLIKSRPGRAIRAIRDNETSAAVSGVHLSRYKTMSFGVASALGGVGGIVYVAELGIASPGDFSQLLAIFFIVGLVVGGVGTLSGAVVGGIVIAFVPEWSSATTRRAGCSRPLAPGPDRHARARHPADPAHVRAAGRHRRRCPQDAGEGGAGPHRPLRHRPPAPTRCLLAPRAAHRTRSTN